MPSARTAMSSARRTRDETPGTLPPTRTRGITHGGPARARKSARAASTATRGRECRIPSPPCSRRALHRERCLRLDREEMIFTGARGARLREVAFGSLCLVQQQSTWCRVSFSSGSFRGAPWVHNCRLRALIPLFGFTQLTNDVDGHTVNQEIQKKKKKRRSGMPVLSHLRSPWRRSCRRQRGG